ncbi:MAG: hypothetical protein M3N10_07805 [Actinomycetota bacterium]|nr:hypothetical protein [Actinomycetota bacterium]HZY65937.1 hypothetical protein [Rubrobacteraceae bacterium]
MAKEDIGVEAIAPGLIVRHTNRHLGKLDTCEACRRLISGSISFSEFVDQVGEGYCELLDFMMDHDLHPGRPEDVIHCIDCYAGLRQREVLRSQLEELYEGFYARGRQAQSVG